MIRVVAIDAEQLQKVLTTGYEVPPLTRVKEGLPPGSILAGVSTTATPPGIKLLFDDGGAGEPVSDYLAIVYESNGELMRMALELADENALEMVQSMTVPAKREDGEWLHDDHGDLEREFRYLVLRGTHERAPDVPSMIRFIRVDVPPVTSS